MSNATVAVMSSVTRGDGGTHRRRGMAWHRPLEWRPAARRLHSSAGCSNGAGVWFMASTGAVEDMMLEWSGLRSCGWLLLGNGNDTLGATLPPAAQTKRWALLAR